MHINCAIRILNAAGVVTDDDCIAGPVIPANMNDLAGRRRDHFKSLLWISGIVNSVMPAAVIITPTVMPHGWLVFEGQCKDLVFEVERGEADITIVAVNVNRPSVQNRASGSGRIARTRLAFTVG